MSGLPQFSLRWNNYVQHVTDAFQALRTHDDLVDVTLCCEGRKINAHKILLSACSAYFKDIFKENPCRHPVVIFRNVKFEDLSAIINFMYHGEVNIMQEQLESFLMTAELLEVKGLTDGSEDDEDNRIGKHQSISVPYFDFNSSQQSSFEHSELNLPYEEPINLATSQVHKPNTTNAMDTPKQPNTYNNVASVATDELAASAEVTKSSVTVTQISGEEMQVDGQNSDNAEDSSDKVNSNETDLAKFRCQLCPKGFKHPTSLTLHRDSHTGKTQCPVCHRSFSRSYDMRSHLQKIHQGKQLTIKEIRYKVSNDTVAPKTFTHHI